MARLRGRRGGRGRPLSPASPIKPAAPVPPRASLGFLPGPPLPRPSRLPNPLNLAGGRRAGGGAPSGRTGGAFRDFLSVCAAWERAADSLLWSSSAARISRPTLLIRSPELSRHFAPTLGKGSPSAAGLRARTKPRSLMVRLSRSHPCALPGLGRLGARTRARWTPSASAGAPSSNARVPSPRGFLLHPNPV